MEYWEELTKKYSEKHHDETIEQWYKRYSFQENEMLKKYGSISWKIYEFSDLLYAGKITNSKFRELVRYELYDKLNNAN